MPQWTPHRSVPGSFGVRAGGAGVLLIRGDNGQELHVFHVDHAVDTDAQRSQAWWCRRRGVPLDAAGNVRGWSAVETHLTGQLLPTSYMAVAPGFLRDAVYPKFSFVGACATRAGGKALLFDRFRHHLAHLSRPDETSEQLRAVGEQRDLPVALRSAESADATLTITNLGRPAQEDLVLVHLKGTGPWSAWYRIGWDLDATGTPRGGWSADKAIPGDFPATGLSVAQVCWGDARHLLVYSLEPSSGGHIGRYRIGYDIDGNGDVRRWGPWIRAPGVILGQIQGLAITIGDVAGDARPDLVVVHIANQGGHTVGTYQVAFDLLDLGAFATAAAPPPLPPVLARAPITAASWSEGRLDLLGVGADDQVFQKSYDQQRWWPDPKGWQPLGGGFSGPPRAISWGPGRLDLLAVGADRSIYQKTWDGRWWPSPSGWTSLGGQFISPPTLASWAANRLDIFSLGADGQLFQKTWDGQRWLPTGSGWQPLGGRFLHPVATVCRAPDALEIFGVGADGAMYNKAWWKSAWTPAGGDWTRLGGRFISPPAAASWGPGRIDVVGIGADGAMWHKTWDNNRWMPSPDGWSSLGGVFTSGPAIVTLGPGSLHLFGLGGDAGLYHREWDGSAWSSWRPLGGVFIAAPVAIGRAGRVDVFGLGTDGAMYQRWWTAAAGWQPSAWVSLGGIFALK